MKYLIIICSLLVFNKTLNAQNGQLAVEKYNDGLTYFENEKWEKALNSCNQAIKLNPYHYKAWQIKGQSEFQLGATNQAIGSISKTIEINPDYIYAYELRAFMYAESHQCDSAEKDFIILYNETKDHEIYIDICRAFDKCGNWEKDKFWVDKYLNIYPEDFMELSLRSFINIKLGDYKASIKDLNKALKIKPEDALCYQNRGLCYEKLDILDSAIMDLESALKYYSKDEFKKSLITYVHNNLGFAQYKNGDVKMGLKNINKSLKMNPDNSYAYKNRAIIYISQNKLKKACSDLNKAKELDYKTLYGDEVEKLLLEHCK